MNIYEELSKAAKVSKEKDEPKEKFLHRMLMEIDQMHDDDFEELSSTAKEWYNEAVKAHNDKKTLPKFPEDDKQEDTETAELNLTGPIIRMLVDHNPKRKGSRSYDEFNLYRDGMTVNEWFQVGGSRASLKWDADKGFIELVKPA